MAESRDLAGKRVAVLAENNYQEMELWYPVLRLREAGAIADVHYEFCDADGRLVRPKGYSAEEYTVAPYDALMKARDIEVVAVVTGAFNDKAPGIRAALKLGLVHTLVTDSITLEELERTLGT